MIVRHTRHALRGTATAGLALLLVLGTLAPHAVHADAHEGATDEAPAESDWTDLDDALLEEEDWLDDDPADRDPIEGVNRATHGFNEQLLEWVVDPLHRLYRMILPGAARRGLIRFFANLNEPVILVNDLLQFSPHDAGRTTARFVINSTAGLAGFLDFATPLGLPGHDNDFGGTLAVYGVPSGAYLVIPVLGPSTVRDALGEAVDGALRPDIWFFGISTQALLLTTGGGMTTYDIQQDRLDALRETSVDYYAALRGAYLMDRDAQIDDRIGEVPWRAWLAERAEP